MLDTNYKNIKVIGFDLDQTLYPKSPEIDAAIQKYIYEKISERLHIDLPAAEKKFTELYQNGQGVSGRKALVQLGFPNEEAENVIQEALENAEIAKFLKPNPDLITLLHILKEKYALDLITGSSQKNALLKLTKLEIPATLFSHRITSDEGSKYLGTSYELWLSYYPEYTLENFLYIGDRPKTDYEVPNTMGIKTILVNVKEVDSKLPCPQLQSVLDIKQYL